MLVLYGLASMHCLLEAVPGFDFLKICCFVEAKSSPCPESPDCESDACAVEKAQYRPEEQDHRMLPPEGMVKPQILLPDLPLLVSQAFACAERGQPPEPAQVWHFSCRTVLLPRAPSPVV